MIQEWHPVYGFEDRFEISNNGTVRPTGPHPRTKALTPWRRRNGVYWMVTLWVCGKRKHRSIHSLLLEAFVSPRPDGYVSRHKDGNNENNSLGNLEWGSCRENHFDKKRHGTFQEGESHGMHKLTEDGVKQIRLSGHSLRYFANKFGVSATCISCARNRKTWKHLP